MSKQKKYVVRIQNLQELENYINETINMLVVVNAYETFWGPVEVSELVVGRMLDEDDYSKKVVFICCDRNLDPELWGKHEFNARPSYFIFHRGTLLETIEGINFPLLMQKIEKHLSLL